MPVDFVSTHIYPDDKQKLVFGRDDVHYPFEEVIPRALAMVREQIKASGFPYVPLYLTEWSSQNPAFIAHTIAGSAGLAEIMSYWTFDSVYEELGVPKTFLSGTYGLLGARGIERPSFHTFSLLHKLGDTRLQTDEGPVLATRRSDGSLAILAWNLIPQPPGAHSSMGDPFSQNAAPYQMTGESITLRLKLQDARKPRRASVTRVDASSSRFKNAYERMSSPAYPTEEQIEQLKLASGLPPSDNLAVNHEEHVTVVLPPNGVALVECG